MIVPGLVPSLRLTAGADGTPREPGIPPGAAHPVRDLSPAPPPATETGDRAGPAGSRPATMGQPSDSGERGAG